MARRNYLNGPTADGVYTSELLNADYPDFQLALINFLDGSGNIATPTAGSVTVTVSADGVNFINVKNGKFNAADVYSPDRPTPFYSGLVAYFRVELSGVAGAVTFNSTAWLADSDQDSSVKTISELVVDGSNAALGLTSGLSAVVKFGHCPNAAAQETDVWELGATIPVYVFPSDAGESMTIESSDPADTQQYTVMGLDENGVTKTAAINLTGTTPVALPGLFTAVNRAYNSDSTPTIGDVSVKSGVNTYAYVDAREQQTTQCILTVPSDKYALLTNVSSAINRSGQQDAVAIVKFVAQENGGVFRTQIRYGLQKRGTSNISSDLTIPALYPPLTRLKMIMEPDAADMDISAELSVQLIDVSLID